VWYPAGIEELGIAPSDIVKDGPMISAFVRGCPS
jgi:tryptophan synthase alpha subunit